MTNYIVVLCSECKGEPIVATPLFGDAKTWDGMLICMSCAETLGKTIRQAWKKMETVS